jgi:DNA-binding GntR family transcriptional regulator
MAQVEHREKSNNVDIGPLKAIGPRKSLGEHVFDTLRQAIVSGHMAPGDRLVESRIAQALEISRTPVREAIHKLEREGFICRRPRGGFTVLGFSPKDIEETFEIRSVLESYAARLAAVKHQPHELDALERSVEAFQECLDAGQMERLVEINTEFHDLLYALSCNPRLVKMINTLRDQIYRFRRMILEDEQMARASNQDHRRMIERIRQRDADGTERLVRRHILKGQKAILLNFRELNQ